MTCSTCNGTGFVPAVGEPNMRSFCPVCRPAFRHTQPQEGAVRSEGNVRILPVVTKYDLPIDRILNAAQAANLKRCIVVGEEQDGTLYFAATFADGPEVLWALERAKVALLQVGGAA